jgi:hypothetical protein
MMKTRGVPRQVLADSEADYGAPTPARKLDLQFECQMGSVGKLLITIWNHYIKLCFPERMMRPKFKMT